MHAAAVRVELRIRGPQSLKEKRHIVKSVTSQLDERFAVSVAEVDDQDKWQKATLGIAVVAPQASRLTEILHRIDRYLGSRDDIEVLRVSTSHLERPE